MRYTHEEKYKDDWFYVLSKEGKLLFYYLIDNVDHAGFMGVVFRRIANDLSMTVDEVKNAFDEMEGKVIWSDRGNKLYLTSFLKNQRNYPINRFNQSHKGIIKKIRDQY